jgi:hypothetical protein
MVPRAEDDPKRPLRCGGRRSRVAAEGLQRAPDPGLGLHGHDQHRPVSQGRETRTSSRARATRSSPATARPGPSTSRSPAKTAQPTAPGTTLTATVRTTRRASTPASRIPDPANDRQRRRPGAGDSRSPCLPRAVRQPAVTYAATASAWKNECATRISVRHRPGLVHRFLQVQLACVRRDYPGSPATGPRARA